MSTLREDIEVLRNTGAFIGGMPEAAIARFIRVGDALAGLSDSAVSAMIAHHKGRAVEHDYRAAHCTTTYAANVERDYAADHRAMVDVLKAVRDAS